MGDDDILVELDVDWLEVVSDVVDALVIVSLEDVVTVVED